MGTAPARASGYGAIGDYLATEDDRFCPLLKVESRASIDALDAILALEGVDGVSIGPADLAADMDCRGKPGALEVQVRIRRCPLARFRSPDG